MHVILITLIITLVMVLLCIAGLAVKTIAGHGEMRRQCAGIDPYTGRHGECACGKQNNTPCLKRASHPYQTLAVNETLMQEL